MERTEIEEWVADENQLSETVVSTAEMNEAQKQEEVEEEQQEPLSPTKVQTSPKAAAVECAQLEETVCIEDGSILLVVLVGKKMQVEGRLRVTNQRLIFLTSSKLQQEEALIEMPIGYIVRCDRSLDDKISSLQVFIRYGCSLKLRCGEGKYEFSLKAHQIINQLIKTSWKLAIQLGSIAPEGSLCPPFRAQVNAKDCYQFDNEGWKRFPNYPERFMVPLNYLSKNSQEQRLVVFSFKYKNAKEEVGVWRTGPGRADASEDEWVPKTKHPSSRSYTLEIKNKGIGSSKSSACRQIQLEGLPLIRQAFSSLFRITFNNHQSLKWLSNFNQTRWLDQIAILLQEASSLVARVTSEQAVMITILADTDIRGAQLAALVQVLLFPEYRTLSGFGELMERELLQWGHVRGGKKEQTDRGAAIIQFLDAVFQLTCIYPLSFEFSQYTLIFLAQNVYSNRFGNFLLASRAIRDEDREAVLRCWSIWQCLKEWVGDPKTAFLYVNPFYVDFKECDIYELKQFPSAKCLRIWNGFFFKRLKEKNVDYHIFNRYQQIYCEHYRNKRQTEQLRKELSQQHKLLVERREVLKDLKALE